MCKVGSSDERKLLPVVLLHVLLEAWPWCKLFLLWWTDWAFLTRKVVPVVTAAPFVHTSGVAVSHCFWGGLAGTTFGTFKGGLGLFDGPAGWLHHLHNPGCHRQWWWWCLVVGLRWSGGDLVLHQLSKGVTVVLSWINLHAVGLEGDNLVFQKLLVFSQCYILAINNGLSRNHHLAVLIS